jgi:hypothetical protein
MEGVEEKSPVLLDQSRVLPFVPDSPQHRPGFAQQHELLG